jgi:hypothetical protein
MASTSGRFRMKLLTLCLLTGLSMYNLGCAAKKPVATDLVIPVNCIKHDVVFHGCPEDATPGESQKCKSMDPLIYKAGCAKVVVR